MFVLAEGDDLIKFLLKGDSYFPLGDDALEWMLFKGKFCSEKVCTQIVV